MEQRPAGAVRLDGALTRRQTPPARTAQSSRRKPTFIRTCTWPIALSSR
jgi:hypothetical protein